MASQSLSNCDGSIPVDHAVVEQSLHGRFPLQLVPTSVVEFRQVNVDQLCESDFDGITDSGLPYSDHDYIGSNPNSKCPPDACQFPVMGGVTDQYLNGETSDPCADSRAADNRLSGPSTPAIGSGSVMRKTQQITGATMFRPAKGEDYVRSGSPQHSSVKSVSWKTMPNVTQPKKSGRPPKNEAGDRLMGRAMIKAGMQTPQGHLQPQMHHPQSLDGMEDLGLNIRGAAPLVTPARGPKIVPRGRSAALPRRDIPSDGSGGYGMVPVQTAPSAYRSISVPSPTKKGGQFRSAQAAEEAHTREMMEAAQNALAPCNATISGHAVMMTAHNEHAIVLPLQHEHHQQQPSHHLDDGDLPRTPGKSHSFTSPLTSPRSGPRRTISESQEMNLLLQEPLHMNPDGLPVTPGGGRKTPSRSRTPRSRMSISESTASGSQATSPQREYVVSPSRSVRHSRLQPRPLHSSPQRAVMAGYIKSPTAPILALAQGPSTMASAQEQMSWNAPMPSLHTQTSLPPPLHHQQPIVSRHMTQVGQSPGRSYYDTPGSEGAPLITASGSNTYTPRRRKEKETDESVEAAVSRNVKNIMLAEKSDRLSSRWSHTLSPRNQTSDEETIRGRQVEQPKKEVNRTSPSKKKQSTRVEKTWSMDEEESEGDEEDEGTWLVTCICGTTVDDGEEMVECDHCKLRWEHVDCIFPYTKKAPEGAYICHYCKPRPTDLTREQARAYQDRVKEQKMRANEQEVKRKLAERAKRKEENSRKPATIHRSNHLKGSSSKIEKSVPSNQYREIEKNEYSANARRFLTVTRSSGGQSRDAEIVNILREAPRVKSLMVEPRIYGLIATREIEGGDYIAELCGHVSLLKECPNRDLAPGSLNDQTFIFEKDGDKIIIDARKCGNYARHIRRSCKPNAELDEIMSGSELHIMIKAKNGAEINIHDEVSIGLESDWRRRGRPAQGCVCSGEEKKWCEVEVFFGQKDKMDNTQTMPSSSRRSLPSLPTLPTNGTTPKGRNAIGGAETEKKKGGSSKKIISKKGKKGTIKLPRHSRKMKGGSGSTADESEGEKEREREGEETEEYEESTADEKEKEVKKEMESPRRGRRNTASTSEGKEKEESRYEIPVVTATRSSTRNRTDSGEVKKEVEVPKYEEKKKETGRGKKEGRKSGLENEKEIKEVSSTPSVKKEKKPWPTMNYSLPSERNKPSREERKIQAEWERMEKSEKSEKKGRVSSNRGRPVQTSTPVSRPNEEKGEKGERRGEGWSGRGKRKTETEDDGVREERSERRERSEREGRRDSVSAAASTPIVVPLKKRWTNDTMRMEREKEKETCSPAPSSLSSMASPPRDDIPAASPAPAGGKKKWLQRHQEEQKAKAEQEAAAAAAAAAAATSTTSTCSSPNRSKRLKKEKEEKGAVEALVNMGGMKEKRGGVREEMKRHALFLSGSLSMSEFSIGKMAVEGHVVPTGSIGCSLTAGPSICSIPPPTTPSIPSVPTDPSIPSIARIESGKKPRMSLDEYRKRKQSGVMASGGMKKEEESEKKEEPPKKSFMPSVHASTGLAPASLPHVKLPLLEEKVDINELARRVYGDTTMRDLSSSSSVPSMGKTQPTPKRQSINDRLKNEFALPSLVTVPPPLLASSSHSPSPSSLPSTSAITLSSPSISSISTPIGGRIHRNRLSDQRADNVIPPGLMMACPRPSSAVSLVPLVSPSPSSIQDPSHAPPPSTPSKSNYSFLQKAASVRSTSK